MKNEPTGTGKLRLPAIFSDHMVLQRDAAIHIWGWTEPGVAVQVKLAGMTAQASAGNYGRWKVSLEQLSASGPHELEISSQGQKIVCRDVLIGDVWLCSGQSNMAMTLDQTDQKPESPNANLRLFDVARIQAEKPLPDVNGKWKLCTEENVALFSAVAYWFGQHLQGDIGVPVGVINSSWGGSLAEAWMTREVLNTDPDFKPILDRCDSVSQSKVPNVPHVDRGNEGFGRGFADPAHKTDDWPLMDLPKYWEETGLVIDGAVWFRRDVEVPAEWAGHDLVLELGALDDFDITYFNGVEVGRMGIDTPSFWERPRIYTIPGKLVKAGRNVIATRIFDQWGPGGFAGKPHQMQLRGPDAGIPLAGSWRWQIELALEQRSSGTARPALVLYNGMIAPIVPLSLRGVTWYQGESNADRAFQYRKLLPALIKNWRDLFQQPEMPFLIVQLANYKARQPEPCESNWAELREAQTMALELPNVGLAVAIDVGEAEDIHPKNKKPVGQRLALEAAKMLFGRSKSSGPRYASYEIEGSKFRIQFCQINGRLATSDGRAVRGFAIAGADKKFVWAEAVIEKNDLLVSSPKTANPVAVRYAWDDNPDCNLCDSENLPAGPFRTDTWPGITVKAG